MRAPTDDERDSYLALRDEAEHLTHLTDDMEHEVRLAFEQWFAGVGPGPTFDALAARQHLHSRERDCRARLDRLAMLTFA